MGFELEGHYFEVLQHSYDRESVRCTKCGVEKKYYFANASEYLRNEQGENLIIWHNGKPTINR